MAITRPSNNNHLGPPPISPNPPSDANAAGPGPGPVRGDCPPAWFQDAMSDLLRPLKDTLERHTSSLQRLERLLDERLAATDQRSATMDQRLATMDQRLATMDQRSIMGQNFLPVHDEPRTGGADDRFEVVLFSNLEDPRDLGLPPLTSRAAIEGLTEEQEQAYYNGYYPNGRDAQEDYTDKIYKAIGEA
ncbi:hypothetical protein BD779DRAFT_1679036 [Infundibulicybe gibba]|nr:hypothetical protein BD779DRAFT_1679036 [Infundibulicybe gibba]